MTISKKKAKMSAGDHGGLLLAAVPIHSSIKDRHKDLTDGSLIDQAVGSLEDFSAKFDDIASMTNLFDNEAGFFDAPKAAPAMAGTAASEALTVAADVEEELADPISIGGIDDGNDAIFSFGDEAGAEALDLDGEFGNFDDEFTQSNDGFVADDIMGEVGIAAQAQDLQQWNDGNAIHSDEAASAFDLSAVVVEPPVASSEDEIDFEVMAESEAEENAVISDKIIKLTEQDEDFDVGDIDDYCDDEDGFNDENFDGPLDDDLEAEPAEVQAEVQPDQHPVYSELDETPVFDMDGGNDEGFGLEDFPVGQEDAFEAEDNSSAGDDWSHLPSPAPEGYGDDDGMGWSSNYDEPAAAQPQEEEIPEEEFFFEDAAPAAVSATSALPVAIDEVDWDIDSFSDFDEPQVSEAASMNTGIKPVDHRDDDISGFDLSSDIDGSAAEVGVAAAAVAVGAIRTTKTEGDVGVKLGKNVKAEPQLEEDRDEFTNIPNEDVIDDFAGLAEDEDEPVAEEAPPVKKKVQRVTKVVKPSTAKSGLSIKTILIASAATAALMILGGGGYMAIQMTKGGSVPAAETSAPEKSASMPTPSFSAAKPVEQAPIPEAPEAMAPEAVTPVAPTAPAVEAPAVEAPAAEPEAQAPVDEAAGTDHDLFAELDNIPAPVEPVQADDGQKAADALNDIAAGLESAANGDLNDLLMAVEPAKEEVPALDLDKALEAYAKVEDVSAFRGEIDEIRSMFEQYRAELDTKEQRIATLEADLNGAKAQAAHAEQLALAQNEVLVEVVRLTDKTDMAESLIVDLSRRVASLEVTDPADRVAVERNFERLDTVVKGLSRDVGMVARVAINGSPVALPANNKSASTGSGSDVVYAESGRVNGLPAAAKPENVPSNAKKGDFVEGYGKVLDIIPTSDGATLIVMENGSVIK